MAKPLPVASSGAPGTSKSTIGGVQPISEPTNRPRHRRNQTSKSPLSSFAPSSGLLFLLASVASASTVSGSPAPPSFLCPSVVAEHNADTSLDKRAPLSSSVTVTPTPSEANDVLLARQHVPVRYHHDADGVWRRVDSYTLYGSTVSACSGTCRQPTNAVSAVDDQIQVSSNKTDTTTTLNQLDDIRDSLPPGWKPTPKVNESRTPLILAVSLVLAFLICSFIIGCLFWRKTVKKNHRSHDVEAKARKKKSAVKEESIVAEKEYKSKQKIWARATARWKANVKYTARQRKGKRFGSRTSQAHQSTLSFDRSRSRLAGSNSSIRSATLSRRSSTSSIRDQLHEEEVTPISPTMVQVPSSPPSSPTQATTNNPPAYQHRGQIPPIIISSNDATTDEYPTTTPQFGRSRRPSHSSNYSASAITNDGQMAELSPTPLHAAHVATDDKSLLARLADLASSPPIDGISTSAGTSEIQVSAPAWQDDDIEDFAPELFPTPSQPSTTPAMFPPPPSKELLAASEFYAYPFSFEEMESLEAECGPSAPPFEEGAPPPLQDSHLLVPSAPPLLGDDDHIRDARPSAPEWNFSSPALDSCEENVAGQDHDRIATEMNAPRPSAPPSSAPPRTPTPPIGPSPPCPANDNMALPGYRP
ncbi:hypothetical protein CVT25_014834 [Psilocybe cyanescens]|uniref:Uncharacterized protein n=1 Tax=Psilocybe cyanescens TaxID=93625 RepID=A0A409WEU4_PSICY|nr:hypothetical protein CVT25_014834 [Psilocybe cyanescens]